MKIFIALFTMLCWTQVLSQGAQKENSRGNGYQIIDYLWDRSDAILKVKVSSIRNDFGSDDMANFFIIYSIIEDRFKTEGIHKDSLSIHFQEKVAWKNLDVKTETKLVVGKSYLIFISTPPAGEYITRSNKLAKYYILIDNILGIQEPTEKLIGYLESKLHSEKGK